MNDPSLRDKVIVLETRLNMIETSVNTKLTSIEADMKEIKNMIAMGRGGWKVVALLGSLILGAIAILKFLLFKAGLPS